MASLGGRRLGAAEGRELVFCHACQHEWYRENADLECPRCHSSFTEIVESSNDPRDPSPIGIDTLADFASASRTFPRRQADDSDPEEGDIEEHLYGGARSSSTGPPPGSQYGMSNASRPGDEADLVFRRFADMLMHDLGAGRAIRRSPGPSGMFPQQEDAPEPQPGPRFHQTTFRAGPFGGRTRVTVTSGTFSGGGTEGSPFNTASIFDPLFGFGAGDDASQRERSPGPGFGFPLLGSLQELMNSLYNPAAAVHGDAVFTQEALDRIITQLMEASPQTNAAPPASETAIGNLEKKKVDDEMLGPEGKVECTICIDEMKKGDEVAVLPCKHWYHGECVVLWLKEHNTCPICRKPIEGAGTSSSGNNGNNHDLGSNSGQRASSSPSSHSPIPNQQPNTTSSTSAPSPDFASPTQGTPFRFSPGSMFTDSLSARPRPDRGPRERDRPLRSARENMDRLNSIRNLTSGNGSGSGSPTLSTSMFRRNSHSPPPAVSRPSGNSNDEAIAQRTARVRSPSASRNRDRARQRELDWGASERGAAAWDWGLGDGGFGDGRRSSQPSQTQHQSQQQQQPQERQGQGQGGGTFGWLRDRFGGRRN
ncbi:uncharacterized protein C8A04DRAFT_10264 [Dichotomopilus funicola]|uniref:RING-type E3 ubiquitin transferase n=1 Tax=Dichotomopilus funicola TaxID=1934379 RepID=A0AAN6V982_9PEZI|nr:hypothetical protein C8A04DRAFT_10264 [Dichotomopilus funicola]